MKILTPSEFKEQNPNAYLEDYLKYLEGAQEEAEETLKNAQILIKDQKIIADIKAQAEEIFQMAMLVEEYMGQIILKTVDTLTLEELQSYFNFDEENRESNERKAKLEEEKRQIQARLAEVEKQIESNLYLNGRLKEFYEIDDVSKFFTPNKKHNEFIEGLLSSLNDPKESEKTTATLIANLKTVLETECRIQNIELTPEKVSELCTEIIKLFNKCKNILKYSKDAASELAEVILSDSGIKAILPEDFDEDTAEYLINDLMNLEKINTSFYSSLPSTLKDKLADKRFEGEPYNSLLRTYQAFLNGEELPSDDLSQDEKDEKKTLEGKLESINSSITSIDEEVASRAEFLTNEEDMRSDLRKQILGMLKGQVSAKDIDSIIKEGETKLDKLKTELEKASSLLSTKMEDLKRAQGILLNPDYHNFFQAVELNNVRRLYNFFGVNVTDEVVLPFLEEEKRRLCQLDIMINLQNKLSDIYKKIKTKKDKANFVTRKFTSYKESLSALDEEYQTAVKEAFEELKQKGLISVSAPIISDESTIGNVKVLPSVELQVYPSDFSGLSGQKQTFWNMSTGIDENTKQRFLTKSSKFDNWEDYYQDLMQKQSELVNKLFTFHKDEDNYYVFESSVEERELLKLIQTTVIEILNSIYEERKAFRLSLGVSPLHLDPSIVEELESFLGEGANLSRENLSAYIEQTEAKVAELKALLADNYTLCMNLGIDLPEDIVSNNDASKDESVELEKRIQALNIEGVTTLEEAIAYRNMLLGLEEFTVPAVKVKEFYSEHKMK